MLQSEPFLPQNLHRREGNPLKDHLTYLSIGSGGGKRGRGSRPPIDDSNPIQKFSVAKATRKLSLS